MEIPGQISAEIDTSSLLGLSQARADAWSADDWAALQSKAGYDRIFERVTKAVEPDARRRLPEMGLRNALVSTEYDRHKGRAA
jgi:hypothetical protein